MGNKSSSASSVSVSSIEADKAGDGKIYTMAIVPKDAGRCQDVWHQNPQGKPYITLQNERKHFPQARALLKGEPYMDIEGKHWFIAYLVQNPGKPWKRAPPGAALPFGYVMETTAKPE